MSLAMKPETETHQASSTSIKPNAVKKNNPASILLARPAELFQILEE